MRNQASRQIKNHPRHQIRQPAANGRAGVEKVVPNAMQNQPRNLMAFLSMS
jgi:hypothetical protein